jgi:phosphoglycerate dehydrogenase-like enzyme
VIPQDSVVGIWGYGDVARWLIRFLQPLEPREIIVCDDYLHEDEAREEGIRKVQFDELFSQSDIVHCLTALTEANKGRVGKGQLDLLRDDAILVNCGRAALIQEEALVEALRENRFTAIMDVFETEPLAEDHPYQSMPNVLLTPHNAGYGRDEYYLAAMLDEFERFFSGRPLETEVSLERAIAMTNSALMRGRSW